MNAIHPCLKHHSIIEDLCNPLQSLGVTFFGYTALDSQGNAYCLGSETQYAEQYLARQHVKNDILVTPKAQHSKYDYDFWDYQDLDAAKEAIYLMAAEFGHTHTVSVTQHFNDMSHSFHFSGTQADKGLNQRLLEKMDCLHLFIDSFKDKLTQVKELAEIYQHSTTVNKAADQRNPLLVKTKAKELDLNQVGHRTLNFTASEFFTENERDTLRWLALGKSAQMIADINQVSRKTIERHIAAIKDKLGCYTLFQMGIKIAEKDMTPFLSKAVN